MRNSASYRKEAWGLLTGNFWPMFLVFVIFYAASFVFEVVFAENVFSWFLFLLLLPLSYGVFWVTLSFSRGMEISPKDMVEPYLSGSRFLRSLGANVMIYIFLLLWTLLLVIPGIIKACSYALVPFILKDDEKIGVMDAITLSRKIMDGHKWRLFKLYFSFIGWGLVVILTFGIAAFFVTPYVYTAFACFYNDVKKTYESSQSFYEPF